MSTTSSAISSSSKKNMTRLRPEGAEQDALDQEKTLKSAISVQSLNNQSSGCLPTNCTGNFTLDLRRRPISALAANSFWSGVSEIKDVLTTGNPLLVTSTPNETAQFYLNEDEPIEDANAKHDHFFEDINTLYKRQTALFQRSCEQLKDLYRIQDQDQDQDHQADANVSEFVLVETKNTKADETSSSDADTIEGTIASSTIQDEVISDEQKIFERTLRRSKIAFKSRIDILKAVTAVKGGVHQSQISNAFGATDMVDVEDLYTEVIYALLHMIGNDAPDDSMQFQLIEHLRKAFRVEPAKHLVLYERAAARDPPQLKLNLCVLEAKELACKDNLSPINDSARGDPFVTVHLKSRPLDMKNTACKSRTIHPIWKETFVLDVPEDEESPSNQEVLHVDVWNFMPDENLREKLRKINDVRDSKGLRQFIMDTIIGGGNAGGGGNNNKLVGSVEIPLSSVPASGLNKWWNIEKTPEKSNKRSRGLIHLLLHLSTNNQKRSTMAAQHRRLLRILLAHELLRHECKPFEWRDQFANEALHILAQHAVQGRMSRVDTAMSRWLVYAQTHALLPLDLRVFPPILERLRAYLQACVGPPLSNSANSSTVSDDSFIEENLFVNDMNEFNMAAEKFSAQCVLFVRKHRYYLGNNFNKYYEQLEALLKCLHILHCLKWRTRGDIVLRVETAVISSVREWYKFVRNQFAKDLDRMENSESEDQPRAADPTDRALSRKMRNLTKLTNLLIADIKTSVNTYRDLFRETLNVDYVELSCKEYEKNLSHLAKNLVTTVCDRLVLNQRRLRRRTVQEQNDNIVIVPEFDLVIGTRLFELYLSLQEFYKLTQIYHSPSSNSASVQDGNTTLSSNSSSSSSTGLADLGPYYTWFLKAVAKWLDIALFKAVQRILKAVELDDLSHPVDEMVMHTCSAVDIRTVFGQVRTFWTQLSWPDAETAYVFVSRILDDICKASVVYARKLVSKCADDEANETAVGSQDITFSREQCHLVNNLDFVLHAIRPLPKELGVDAILQKLEDIHGGLVADACRKTINILVKHSAEVLENHIMDILEHLSSQMAPKITAFLLEATPTDRTATPIKLLRFLDANLIFLKSFLVPANFSRVLSSVWRISTLSLANIIQQSIAEKRDVKYFSHLSHVFAVLLNFFYGNDQPSAQQPKSGHLNIPRTTKLLQLYSASSEDLIQNYYSERFRYQLDQQHPNGNETSVYPIGSINVRAIVHETHLRIEVLNARHLKPLETQKGQKNEAFKDTTANKSSQKIKAFAACLSAPEDSLVMIEQNPSRDINEQPSWKSVGVALDDIRTRFDNARQQLIEEAVSVSRNGGITSTVIGIGSNGMCNPYVSIRLVPDVDGSRFHCRGLKKVKTAVKHRTLFPLFDETFDMVLPEGTDVSKTYLLFSVKDQSPVLGEGLLLGEALLPLADIVKEDGDVSLKDVSQIQLGLSRPNEKHHSDLLNAMTVRLAETNQYREFLRKEKRKMIV